MDETEALHTTAASGSGADTEVIAAGIDTEITGLSSTGAITAVPITGGGAQYKDGIEAIQFPGEPWPTIYDYYVDVTFTGGGGSGAKGRGVVTAGAITGVTMTSGGIGYSSSPTAVFTRRYNGSWGAYEFPAVAAPAVVGDVDATGT